MDVEEPIEEVGVINNGDGDDEGAGEPMAIEDLVEQIFIPNFEFLGGLLNAGGVLEEDANLVDDSDLDIEFEGVNPGPGVDEALEEVIQVQQPQAQQAGGNLLAQLQAQMDLQGLDLDLDMLDGIQIPLFHLVNQPNQGQVHTESETRDESVHVTWNRWGPYGSRVRFS